MSNEIKEGSVVRLKSGGPQMTVSATEVLEGVLYAHCTWFIQDKEPWKQDHSMFRITSLSLLQP